MSNGIQTIAQTEIYQPVRYSIGDLQVMADAVAKSGLFKMTAPQVLTLMMISESTGLHPIQAMMRYHVIEGRPSMRADAMLAEFQKAGGRIEWVKDTESECEAIFYHDRQCPNGKAVSFTIADARKAGLADRQIWKSHPRPLMRARVITNGVRMILPGVIMGIYSEDEVDEITNSPAETGAHARLRDKLAEARRRHQPPAQVATEIKSAQEPGQQAEALEGPTESIKSEFRAWVDEQLEQVNRELPKPMTPFQVANHLLKVGIDEAIIDPTHITGPDGKRDKSATAAVLAALWEEDFEWAMDTAGKYLAQKVAEAHAAMAPDSPLAVAVANEAATQAGLPIG
jgi:hypothetical protein